MGKHTTFSPVKIGPVRHASKLYEYWDMQSANGSLQTFMGTPSREGEALLEQIHTLLSVRDYQPMVETCLSQVGSALSEAILSDPSLTKK